MPRAKNPKRNNYKQHLGEIYRNRGTKRIGKIVKVEASHYPPNFTLWIDSASSQSWLWSEFIEHWELIGKSEGEK